MKNVIRSFVMLGLVFGLMVMGCPTEEKGDDDPSKGKTVEEQYRGVYKKGSDNPYEVTSNKFIHWFDYGTNNQSPDYSWSAWTEGKNLYVYGHSGEFYTLGTNVSSVFKLGYFEANKLVINYGDGDDMKGDYLKQQ